MTGGPRREIRHDVGARGPGPDLELGRRRSARGLDRPKLHAAVTGAQPRGQGRQRVRGRRGVEAEADRGRAARGELVGWSLGDDPAAVQDRDAVRKPLDVAEVVRGQEDRPALIAK